MLEKACSLVEANIFYISLLFFSTKFLAGIQSNIKGYINNFNKREKNVARSWEEIVYWDRPRNNPEVEIITHGLQNKCDTNAFENLI